MAKPKILVVEDSKLQALDLKNKLIELGYKVPAVANTGNEAIKKSKEISPDLILMDIILKGKMDGIEAVKYIREKFDIPIIFLTSSKNDKIFKRAKVTKPYGYILKPLKERELHITIEIALDHHRIEKELKKEKELREIEKKYKELADSLPETIYEMDAKGNIIFINKTANQMFGYTLDDFTRGMDPLKILIPEDRERAAQNLEMTLKGIPGTPVEYTGLRKDNSSFPIILHANPIMDKGRCIGARGMIIDITKHKQIEEQLIKTGKLKSLGILAGGIAHDFNNLLTAIIGSISLARTLADPDNEIFEILTNALNASQKTRDLTKQLLTFSKGGAPIKKVSSIPKLIKDTAKFTLRGSSVKYRFHIPNNPLFAEIDEGQFSQVIENIIINAMQAMPKGGIINIYLEGITIKSEETIPLKNGQYIKITIKDQGTGISKEDQLKIFDPFFTTKPKGSGLGLTTSYSIIKKHNGYINIESEEGKGTSVFIYLHASAKKTLITKEEDKKIQRGEGKILLMDDEGILLQTGGKMLKRLGYEIKIVKDGRKAVTLFKSEKKSGHPFNAVILDLTVPGNMGGEETIKELKKIDPEIKAIVSSGYSNDPVISNFKKFGFKGILIKPYEINNLSEVLNKVIKG